jgi:hypothetical protein
MRSWANQYQAFYGPITIQPPLGVPLTVVQPGASSGGAIQFTASGNATNGQGQVAFDGSGNMYIENNLGSNLTIGSFVAGSSISLTTAGSGRLTIAAAGNVTVNAPTSGDALTTTGVSGAYAATFNGAASSTGAAVDIVGGFTGAGTTGLLRVADTNNTNGVNILLTGNGATTPSKYFRVLSGALQIINSAYTTTLLTMDDVGGTFLNGATGGSQGAGTFNATGLFVNGVSVSGGGATTGSFTATFVGGTTSPTSTGHWTKIGTQVVCSIPAPGAVVSNSTSTSITGIPVAIQPASVWQGPVVGGFLDNGTSCVAGFTISSGTINLTKTGVTGTLWTASGNKSMSNTIFVWDLN